MSAIIPQNPEDHHSPFDAIRRFGEHGEYWTGRDLMPLMDYGQWVKFAAVIEKAKSSLAIVEGATSADHHFPKWESDGGRWGNQGVEDYRITRFGAYLTAMAGDDTKESVARARVYFAVQTRRAETMLVKGRAIPQNFEEALTALLSEVRTNRELTTQVEEMREDQHAWQVLASEWNDFSVRTAAAILNRDPAISMGQNTLFTVLREFGMVDRKNMPYARHKSHLVQKLGSEFTDPNTGVVRIGGSQVRVTTRGLKYVHKKLGGVVPVMDHIEAERRATDS